MLPANGILEASVRWLRLLRTSACSQAWALIRADAAYSDLSLTQYASALEWLLELGIVGELGGEVRLLPGTGALPAQQALESLYERALEFAQPAWLRDSDLLVRDAGDLPLDALDLATSLSVEAGTALHLIHHLQRKIDLELRNKIGRAGEMALLSLLEARWPGSTVHVAEAGDGFGYDIAFKPHDVEWHLEVKSSTRRGRLNFFLSRHEFEVGSKDTAWRIVLVGLDSNFHLVDLATTGFEHISDKAPRDVDPGSRWENASFLLSLRDVQSGLGFLEEGLTGPE